MPTTSPVKATGNAVRWASIFLTSGKLQSRISACWRNGYLDGTDCRGAGQKGQSSTVVVVIMLSVGRALLLSSLEQHQYGYARCDAGCRLRDELAACRWADWSLWWKPERGIVILAKAWYGRCMRCAKRLTRVTVPLFTAGAALLASWVVPLLGPGAIIRVKPFIGTAPWRRYWSGGRCQVILSHDTTGRRADASFYGSLDCLDLQLSEELREPAG